MQTRCVLAVLCVMFVLPVFAHAQTGDVSGTWTLAGSPYTITGDIRVADGSTLTIEPGVAVLFSGPFSLRVEGTLTAVGTAAQPITFTRATPTEDSKWQGIRFESAVDDSVLEYCVIEYTHREDAFYQNVRGGAVSINACSPTVRHCTIRHNYTHNMNRNGAGSAILIAGGSTSLIEYNHLSHNESDSGGAICIFDSNSWPIIRHNLIEHNLAHSSGGGIYVAANANVTINNNIFRYNTAEYWGGGAITLWNNYCYTGPCTDVYNNLIYQNDAVIAGGVGFGNGGGIYCRYNVSNQFNNTITGNSAQGQGGGLYVLNQGNSIPVITNTVVWNNTAAQGPQIHLVEMTGSTGNPLYSLADINYSNIQGGWADGTGNINGQPLFRHPVRGDYQLQTGSPGMDAGDNSLAGLPATDFGGGNRIVDGDSTGGAVVDMGAWEFDPAAEVIGDVDGSQTNTLNDAQQALQLLTDQDIGASGDISGGDANQDGKIGSEEAQYNLQDTLPAQ